MLAVFVCSNSEAVRIAIGLRLKLNLCVLHSWPCGEAQLMLAAYLAVVQSHRRSTPYAVSKSTTLSGVHYAEQTLRQRTVRFAPQGG